VRASPSSNLALPAHGRGALRRARRRRHASLPVPPLALRSGRSLPRVARRAPAAGGRAPSGPATTERDGYVWFWYGTAEPLYPLPGPAIDQAGPPRTYRVFHLEDSTGTTVRRVLENTFDPDHLVALHGLDVQGSTDADLLDPARADAEFGHVDPADSRLCAILGWPAYGGWLGRVAGALDLNAQRFELRVAAWPTLRPADPSAGRGWGGRLGHRDRAWTGHPPAGA
jgi:hypothetical protein